MKEKVVNCDTKPLQVANNKTQGNGGHTAKKKDRASMSLTPSVLRASPHAFSPATAAVICT